ncbi:MAG: helix-turn-helix transcriptional regulator [Oscillospiraceae bacterium]|nr:helix-turn-helix transcriptional regulator [Oscillospiraceae bacterium]
MNNDFPRILALLRKERNLSQKQAANDLGVAQALLSHYEKGKRECGLAFLVKAADYYNVSADYLLGRSASSDGSFISENDMPDAHELGDDKAARTAKNISATLAKKMIIGGIDVIYSLLCKTNNPKLTSAVSEFFTLTIYSCFRLVYRSNPKNNNNIFSLKEETAFRAANAGRLLCEGRAVIAADESTNNTNEHSQVTTASLESDYNKQAIALMSLVKNSERIIGS